MERQYNDNTTEESADRAGIGQRMGDGHPRPFWWCGWSLLLPCGIRAHTGNTEEMAIRAHSGGVVGHYYCHVAFVHIQEILEESGHMMAGNDEVLEKGNHTIKEYKRLTFKGGTSVKGASAFFRQRRLRLAEKATPEEEDTYTAVFVKRARNVGVVLQAGELQLAAEVVTAQRKHTSITQSGAVKEAAAQRRVVTEVVKTETVAGLLTNTLPAPVSLPAPRAPPKRIYITNHVFR